MSKNFAEPKDEAYSKDEMNSHVVIHFLAKPQTP